mgnify:CR=1 FL=1
MATSGTTAFSPDLAELVEEAFERAGLESFNGYDLHTARRSMNFLLLEWAAMGINMWTVEQGTQALPASDGQYDLPTDTVDLLEAHIRTGTGTSQVDQALERISFSVYASIPNKNTTGRPVQYYVQRNTTTSTVDLWPIPDSAATYTLVYWRMRRIQEAGAGGAYTQDVPFRFIPALVSGLAYHIALKKSKDPTRIVGLKTVYEQDLRLAQTDDRDRSSWFLRPHVSAL